MKQNERIIIIGAGLSGLTLAYLLSKKNVYATVLEASNRCGGRIQTIKGENETPMELGATWFSDIHPNLISLLDELELKKFPQYSKGKSLFQTKSFEPAQEFYIPEAETPSYRIAGGTEHLISTLYEKIDAEHIKLKTKVVCIEDIENELIVHSNKGEKFIADKVILCLPVQLVGSQIKFIPELPNNISAVLPTVQTWMAGSIKFVLEYSEPFWRRNGYSGMLYSHVGIVSEMYDHTNFEEDKFGFTGFLNGSSSTYTKALRKALVLKQLEELLGEDASTPLTYSEKIWTDDFILNGNRLINIPHQNNGHPVFKETYMGDKLYFSGTESTDEFSGYMEGAILSALNTLKKIRE
ncbi:amine oxidase [Formosa agariphila KMM 3901]|uniref:Amine oxidase n=1 Tax=Formosa agariphila (strain DSM 15362 / KCTC 12365 / LMG 23005 / KMM 3901 / M-2Alg 35-1) TaxID=1347342 RepID=T2KND6_FORAG|nr:FAD-dependent oxidoreductase [Formosa agariphila]CDF79504.1 amine oxidase [Formosa agariphila KMM 3901]